MNGLAIPGIVGCTPTKLKTRFLKNKYTIYDTNACVEENEEAINDDYWDEYFYYRKGSPEDYFYYKLRELSANQFSGFNTISFDINSIAVSKSKDKDVVTPKIEREEIISTLVHNYTQDHFPSFSMVDDFFENISKNISSNLPVYLVKDYPRLIGLMFVYKSLWVRPIQSWEATSSDIKTVIESLLYHLFGNYSVPQYLLNSIINPRELHCDDNKKWFTWFILNTKGISIREVAKALDWRLSRKFMKKLDSLKTEKELNMDEACFYAYIMLRGGNLIDCERIITHPYSRQHLDVQPFLQSQASHGGFFDKIIDWIIKNNSRLTDDTCDLFFDWAVHLNTENTEQIFKIFSFDRALHLAQEYRDSIIRTKVEKKTWESHGWNWNYKDQEENNWDIVELTNSKELFIEGNNQRHCVSSYSTRCVNGLSAIFSLKRNEKTVLTIEVNPDSKTIRQALGKFNRLAKAEEVQVYQMWLKNKICKKKLS